MVLHGWILKSVITPPNRRNTKYVCIARLLAVAKMEMELCRFLSKLGSANLFFKIVLAHPRGKKAYLHMAEDYGVYSYIAKYTIPYKKQQIHCSVGG